MVVAEKINLAAEIYIRTLSPWFRRQYWQQHADEADASVLWPGFRRILGQHLAGDMSIVTAAITQPHPVQVASRSVFNRSRLYPDLWYYGYLLTLPEFRRQGLGERVIQAGLAEIRRAGAKYCSCYVEYGNRASVDLAERLGLVRLPLVRMVVRGVDSEITGDICLEPAHSPDVRQWVVKGEVQEGTAGEAIAADELHVPRSSLPWRSPDSALYWLYLGERIVGVARVSAQKSVVVPVIAPINSNSRKLTHAMVAAVSQAGCPVFVFASPALCGEYVDHYAGQDEVSCKLFSIFWTELNKPAGSH